MDVETTDAFGSYLSLSSFAAVAVEMASMAVATMVVDAKKSKRKTVCHIFDRLFFFTLLSSLKF